MARLKKKHHIILSCLLAALLTAALVYFLHDKNFAVLNPRGTIAEQQRGLLITATLLMLIVVIPVFVMATVFALRYREGNKKAKYRPAWDGNLLIETIWWFIPFAIIAVISVMTWKSSHSLDPYRPIESSKKTVTVQVVALDWKWLFIYPDERVASINYLRIPEDTPVNFKITSDAPMNSFWIPQLGGQVYAMAGMSTQLNLMAGEPGRYDGVSANLSGEGFAGMKFTAEATSASDYEQWLETTRSTAEPMDYTKYTQIAEPSKDNLPVQYRLEDHNLYDKIVMKYMMPQNEGEHHH